jgi:hypothetical protein
MHLSLKILTYIELFGNGVFSNRESGATNRENSVDYSILTPMEILQREQERAIPNRQTEGILWTLHGEPADDSLLPIDYIYNCVGPELRIVPVLRIPQSISIDAGGIFRDKVNRVFDYLMESDIFVTDHTTGKLTFAEFDEPILYRAREKYPVDFIPEYATSVNRYRLRHSQNWYNSQFRKIYLINFPPSSLETSHHYSKHSIIFFRERNYTSRIRKSYILR